MVTLYWFLTSNVRGRTQSCPLLRRYLEDSLGCVASVGEWRLTLRRQTLFIGLQNLPLAPIRCCLLTAATSLDLLVRE